MDVDDEHSRGIIDRLGDQRAKDLIDKNEGERDPRRAIRRLHRALRYGRSSIQAMKAYLDLGMYYEQLGNTHRAITYYTRAIDLGPSLDIPPLPELYWRGLLYYQRGD
jgi:tetratricopeptide (TPR) repeat protein